MSTRDEEFVRRLFKRRPDIEARYRQASQGGTGDAVTPEGRAPEETFQAEPMPETIVRRERPVLFIKRDSIVPPDDPDLGFEAKDLVAKLTAAKNKVTDAIPLVGRIDVVNFPNNDYLGTGWFVAEDIVVTNRHVASLIAKWDGRRFVFTRGIGGQRIDASVATMRELDEASASPERTFAVREVLFIERESSANDIAFLRVSGRRDPRKPIKIDVAASDLAPEKPVCVIGYPARAPRSVIPDQDEMRRLFADQYDVKRIAPGLTMEVDSELGSHDCTTLGGNSGSVVLDLDTGKAAGLHFAGRYKEANYAVPASVLSQYVSQRRWNTPIELASRRDGRADSQAAGVANVPATNACATAVPAGSVTVTIPLTITVGLGTPVAGVPAVTCHAVGATTNRPSGHKDIARVEAAAVAFADARPPGVLGVRVGFVDDGERFTDNAFIAASVAPDRVADFTASQPSTFDGIPVRYIAADVSEQLEATLLPEISSTISYDDDARKGADFSFAFVHEEMDVTMHVGPEYSWHVLQKFLNGADGDMVCAMYEFHGPHIAKAIEAQLENGLDLTLVIDNTTFSKIRDRKLEFDRIKTFERWANDYKFRRVVAPEGSAGLISDAYHIKVSVRSDDTFWLSSGNWKMGSSQPVIDDHDLRNATVDDLRGNREWHVVIKNKTLANRFRSHIRQDFRTSRALGGDILPPSKMDETTVQVPLDGETILEERKPPERVIKPRTLTNQKVKVKPLLTPDQEGAVYSKEVLKLIDSATTSLLFQIPYIGMRPKPKIHRGFIDDLIDALTAKLLELDDARVLLRSGSSKYSDPRHAAWYFKSKGVDIEERLRVIDDHHTKGMIVDGKRVLIGSHNWSKPGVTLNRDASLLFHDEEVAAYYTDAFEVDWARAGKLTAKKFVPKPAVTEGPVAEPIYHRVPLSSLLGDD